MDDNDLFRIFLIIASEFISVHIHLVLSKLVIQIIQIVWSTIAFCIMIVMIIYIIYDYYDGIKTQKSGVYPHTFFASKLYKTVSDWFKKKYNNKRIDEKTKYYINLYNKQFSENNKNINNNIQIFVIYIFTMIYIMVGSILYYITDAAILYKYLKIVEYILSFVLICLVVVKAINMIYDYISRIENKYSISKNQIQDFEASKQDRENKRQVVFSPLKYRPSKKHKK